jgi:hypothetical protein
MTELLKNIYLCNSDGSYRQMVHTVSFKSLSSFFSHSGSSGMVFLCQKQNPGINRGKIINRSVSKIFDCVGLTKPRLISKLGNFCYLRFYAAILEMKNIIYSNMDIESPMSADEKELNNKIASIYSEINTIIIEKRKLKIA